MCANGANLGCVLANVDVAAVAALPEHIAVAGEYDAALDVLEQLAVALLMLLLDRTNAVEQLCDVLKAFFACFLL